MRCTHEGTSPTDTLRLSSYFSGLVLLACFWRDIEFLVNFPSRTPFVQNLFGSVRCETYKIPYRTWKVSYFLYGAIFRSTEPKGFCTELKKVLYKGFRICVQGKNLFLPFLRFGNTPFLDCSLGENFIWAKFQVEIPKYGLAEKLGSYRENSLKILYLARNKLMARVH
jgi:hypothetical protein